MKQIVCTACGNPNLTQYGNIYYCQYCGAQYSAEQIQKMMIEGVVSVQGTVQIDNNPFIWNSLQNARRAKQKEDWEETEKYYNFVEQYQPNNIEAIFYSSYAKVRQYMVEDSIYKRQQICDSFCKSISIIDDNYDTSKSSENKILIDAMSRDLFSLYLGNFVFNVTTYSNGMKTDNSEATYLLFAKIAMAFVESMINITQKDNLLDYHKIIFYHTRYLSENIGLNKWSRGYYRNNAIQLLGYIQQYDPSFQETIPDIGGCYVATCVYGSYDCPEVWTLRRFRDFSLAKTWHGRAFIRTYYAISPTLVKWFGSTKWFKKMWRGKLDRMVKKLQEKGYESTQYYDR